MSKKKIIKIVIICLVLAALLGGLIALMVLPPPPPTPHPPHTPPPHFGERIWIGLQVAFMGLGTVFVMLFILILMVTLMRLLFSGAAKLSQKRAEKKAALEQTKVLAIEHTPVVDQSDDEVVAAITAALMAYYDEQNLVYKSNLKFRVRSIKEI